VGVTFVLVSGVHIYRVYLDAIGRRSGKGGDIRTRQILCVGFTESWSPRFRQDGR